MLETSVETKLAIVELKKLQEGEVCSYEALRAAIGKDPQGDGYVFVKSARRKVEKENDCVLEAVPNVGIQRLKPREVVNRGARDLAHTRRSVRGALRRQITLTPVEKVGELTNEDRIQYHAQLSHLGMLSHALKPKVAKRIEERVSSSNSRLEVGGVLELMAKKNGAQ